MISILRRGALTDAPLVIDAKAPGCTELLPGGAGGLGRSHQLSGQHCGPSRKLCRGRSWYRFAQIHSSRLVLQIHSSRLVLSAARLSGICKMWVFAAYLSHSSNSTPRSVFSSL